MLPVSAREGQGEKSGALELEDGSIFEGHLFGDISELTEGEVVFNTGMVGYVEALTDPSYLGQILCFTYPLIGNYGVPDSFDRYESGGVKVRGIAVSDISGDDSHWESGRSLSSWMKEEGICGISGIDTRALTKHLRHKGTMLGRVIPKNQVEDPFSVDDPNSTNLVKDVSVEKVSVLPPLTGRKEATVGLLDCGYKRSIARELRNRAMEVRLLPHDTILMDIDIDGVMISNGPGDPALCMETAENIRSLMEEKPSLPIAGICLGTQIMALAAGGKTYKLPFGHRSQNQPCREVGTEKCVITSQNHGYAVDGDSLPGQWEIWYENLNDGSVEGIKHGELPYFSVQFHPEASPGPRDSCGFFDLFFEVVMHD